MADNKNTPFSNTRYDLGSDDNTVGYDLPTVQEFMRRSQVSSVPVCIACGQPAKYRLMAKVASLNTEELRKRGYICEHCLRLGTLSPAQYGVRSLE